MAGTSSKLSVADPGLLSFVTAADVEGPEAETQRQDARKAFLAAYAGSTGRPTPPLEVLPEGPALFLPSPELEMWTVLNFLTPGAAFWDQRNAHLEKAAIAFLWAREPLKRQGKMYCGTAELAVPPPSLSGWKKQRFEAQFRDWFGEDVRYDFLITIWAEYAARVNDTTFCSTIFHELCHCGQRTNDLGEPLPSRATGLPVYKIVGHDVEEFVAVVEWFGVGAAAGETRALVEAAGRKPLAAEASIAGACGTCRPPN